MINHVSIISLLFHEDVGLIANIPDIIIMNTSTINNLLSGLEIKFIDLLNSAVNRVKRINVVPQGNISNAG